MFPIAQIRPAYSRAERLSDGAVHVVGLVAAVLAVPALITLAALFRTETAAIVGASVYGASLLLMLTFSALYNMTDNARWSGLLRRLDHSGIYVKIAGTYTPFVLLSGIPAPGFLAGLWGSAAIGSVLKFAAPDRFRWFALTLYLAMGWAAVWAGGWMLAGLPTSILVLMIVGGALYTIGVAFFLLERLPFHNTIWHVFVLAGSVLFFIAVALNIAGAPVIPV
ncbi:hemolysin III family protein [Tropicimonas sp. IMCC6043]|uniref:PAQR family membrane homeostasis protein TrhA n=1 Tax=Tropicimonas sp. IMCC6043 TaxID=2510645 RepID=UPI00101D5A46|nr:hemolysin III family protein [Tropicimonas sp. IMCC6043]RYH12143.1 Hly-III family protein [Tropicimonas sp. IMCC6043]